MAHFDTPDNKHKENKDLMESHFFKSLSSHGDGAAKIGQLRNTKWKEPKNAQYNSKPYHAAKGHHHVTREDH